jgi:hypothetical protein
MNCNSSFIEFLNTVEKENNTEGKTNGEWMTHRKYMNVCPKCHRKLRKNPHDKRRSMGLKKSDDDDDDDLEYEIPTPRGYGRPSKESWLAGELKPLPQPCQHFATVLHRSRDEALVASDVKRTKERSTRAIK